MYTKIDQIVKAFFDLMDQCPFGEFEPQQRKEWFMEQPEGPLLVTLWQVCFDAQKEAPAELVGVGRITYAEAALVAYQEGLKNDNWWVNPRSR